MQSQDTHRVSGSVLITIQSPQAVCWAYCSPGFTTSFPAACENEASIRADHMLRIMVMIRTGREGPAIVTQGCHTEA